MPETGSLATRYIATSEENGFSGRPAKFCGEARYTKPVQRLRGSESAVLIVHGRDLRRVWARRFIRLIPRLRFRIFALEAICSQRACLQPVGGGGVQLRRLRATRP